MKFPKKAYFKFTKKSYKLFSNPLGVVYFDAMGQEDNTLKG